MRGLRHLAHLISRFFGVLSARGLTPREQAEVAGLLRAAEASLYWRQTTADQRHGLECARRVLRARPGRRSLARAALLHDVGKRHARLGIIGRSLASGLALLRLPVRGRMRRYLDHGPLGARDLEAAGAEPLVVSYAHHHHGPRPAGVPEPEWQLLQRADHERV